MPSRIQDDFLEFVSRSFSVEKDEINLEKSLVDEGIIDSFGLVEICAYMENEFGIVVEDDQMTRDNFGSVVKIVNFIENQINGMRLAHEN